MRVQRLLVTGAGGSTGSLVEELAQLGANVRDFVRYNSRGDEGLLRLLPVDARKEIEVIRADLRNGDAVGRAAKGADTAFYLGAVISIPYSCVHRRETTSSNLLGTINGFPACRDQGVCRLIHTSTSEIHGQLGHLSFRATSLSVYTGAGVFGFSRSCLFAAR